MSFIFFSRAPVFTGALSSVTRSPAHATLRSQGGDPANGGGEGLYKQGGCATSQVVGETNSTTYLFPIVQSFSDEYFFNTLPPLHKELDRAQARFFVLNCSGLHKSNERTGQLSVPKQWRRIDIYGVKKIMQVHFHATLRDDVGGRTVEVPVEAGQTIHELIDALIDPYPSLKSKFWITDDSFSPYIHIFMDGRNILLSDGLDTRIPPNARINIFPPIAGG
jgi:molybdopterin synthase sulfur carrier subunit